MWWRGFSYGPRLLAEVQPYLLLSSVPTCKSIFEQRQPKLGMLFFFLLFAWSSSTQVLGAYVPSDWNWAPKSVDKAPGRVWDWGDNPMSRSVQVIERFLASHLPGANPSPSQPRPKIPHPSEQSKRLFPSIERPVSGKSLPIYARQSNHPLAIELEQNHVFVWNPVAALRAIDPLLIAAKGYRL